MKKSTQSELDALKQQVEKLTAEKERAIKMAAEEAQRASAGMNDAFELAKAQKQIRVIEHIAAGRKDEAILEILTPMPLLFNIEVRYGDDKTRIAAEDQLLARLKKTLADNLDSMELRREPKELAK